MFIGLKLNAGWCITKLKTRNLLAELSYHILDVFYDGKKRLNDTFLISFLPRKLFGYNKSLTIFLSLTPQFISMYTVTPFLTDTFK